MGFTHIFINVSLKLNEKKKRKVKCKKIDFLCIVSFMHSLLFDMYMDFGVSIEYSMKIEWFKRFFVTKSNRLFDGIYNHFWLLIGGNTKKKCHKNSFPHRMLISMCQCQCRNSNEIQFNRGKKNSSTKFHFEPNIFITFLVQS